MMPSLWGNLFGLVILWQSSLVTPSGFSAPLYSVACFSWDWAPPFKLAIFVIDCLLHFQDMEPNLQLKT